MSGEKSSVPAAEPGPQQLAGEALLPTWVKHCLWLVEFTSQKFPYLGGAGTYTQMRHSINIGKGLTLVVAFLLMVLYGNVGSVTSWTYVALHGSYAVLWVAKDYCFPDPRWNVPQTLGGFVNVLVVLAGYWIAPYLLNANHFEASNVRLFVAMFLYVFGVTLMFGSDCQKYYQLKYRRGLITDGFFKYTRNPNYVGEMMLYAAFALVSGSWVPWAYLAVIWTIMFYPNMCRKDASICRYPEWPQYAAQSGMLVPNFAGAVRDFKATIAAEKQQ